MKKAKLLAPRNAAREILSDVDAQRMLESGSWVIAMIPKKPTQHALTQREFESRRREAGFKALHILMPRHVIDELHARCREGETLAKLIERLLSETAITSESMVGTQK